MENHNCHQQKELHPKNIDPIQEKRRLYVTLDPEIGPTIVALVNLRVYVSADSQKELNRTKQQAPANFLKIDDPARIQKQVAKGQLGKPLETVILNFDIGNNTFSVVLKNVTGSNMVLHLIARL